MPLTKCPHCGRVMNIHRDVLGNVVGCIQTRCETRFKATEYRLHSGWPSRVVFFTLIVFAVYLSVVWLNKQYSWF